MLLPEAATLEDSVEPADIATPSDLRPSGFIDVPWLLDRAGAWLRAHAGGAASQPTLWQRQDVHGWQTDVLQWTTDGFTLRTRGDDTTIVVSESGCRVRVGQFAARCEPDVRAQAVLAAALTGLTWPDGPGRAAWSVEAMHTHNAQDVRLRLAMPRLHLRMEVALAADGTVQAPGVRALGASLQPDADGFAYRVGPRPSWHWSAQPPGGAEPFGRTMLRLDNTAGVDLTVEAWEAAAKPRDLRAMGPFEAEVDVRDDGVRIRALQAPVLAQPDEGAWKGVQVVTVKQMPVQSVFRSMRYDLMKTMAKNLSHGCHVVQLLGISPDAPEAPSGEVRRDAETVIAVRPCP